MKNLIRPACVLLVACWLVMLSLENWRLSDLSARLEKKLTLVRILAPGRTLAEVAEWMGPPTRLDQKIRIGEMRYPQVARYFSNARDSLNGSEDVWIGCDERGTIRVVYYPDHPAERRMVTDAAQY